ncbi:MAG: hypothetical protein SGPRY_011955, partial [Prymnesium sp.]
MMERRPPHRGSPTVTEATRPREEEEDQEGEEGDEGVPLPPLPTRNPAEKLDPQVVRVKGDKALLTFSYDIDVPIEKRYNITEGALLRELKLQAALIDEDFPQFVGGTIKVPRGRPASIEMDSIDLANKFAEEVPLLMVDAIDKEDKEAIAHLTVG